MSEKIIKTLRDSKGARWGALAVVSFTMLTGYYINYVISPLKPLLETNLNWTSTEFGIWNSAYGWFNVFFLMLIFGGIILDKMGVRFTGLGAAITMIIGTFLQFAAIDGLIPAQGEIFGINSQVAIGALGFGIFGVGVEIAGITVSKIIVKWFKGKELALAMGLEMATARMGTALALSLPYPMATAWFGTEGSPALSAPIMLGLGLLVAGFVAFLWYTFMDKKLDASIATMKLESNDEEEEESFQMKDILLIVKNKGFWMITLLCVLFYSGIFPFLYYAADLMVNKYGINPKFAGAIPGLLPFGTILLTPLFGRIYDKKGKGATIMLLGSVFLLAVHAVFAIPSLSFPFVAIALIVFLGVTFSLVPSAMWPSVPKIIPEKQLGSAYALIFWVQNWGLMGMPLLIGWVLNKYSFLAYFTILGSGFTVTQEHQLASATLINNQVVELNAPAQISQIDSLVKVTNYTLGQDMKNNTIITELGEEINIEKINKKQLVKLEEKNEISIIYYYYNFPSTDTLVTVASHEGKKITLENGKTVKLNKLTKKQKKLIADNQKIEIEVPGDRTEITSFTSIDNEKVSKYLNVTPNYNYTIPMLIFALTGLFAIIIALLLKRENKIKGYGLEEPNTEQ